MGLTPLGGVMMGTRTGDIDPSVMDYLCNQTGKSVDEMYDIFNKKSGLLGVSGVSNDTRDIEAAAEKGNERAMIASKLFARRIADFIGSYYVRLGHVDVIIFSAGIGENSSWYRKLILEDVQEALDLKIDWAKNDQANGKQMVISKPESKIKVCVIPTDEEVMIARDCLKEIEGTL
jgi:acetate kinase